jgi:hypothetical protein
MKTAIFFDCDIEGSDPKALDRAEKRIFRSRGGSKWRDRLQELISAQRASQAPKQRLRSTLPLDIKAIERGISG